MALNKERRVALPIVGWSLYELHFNVACFTCIFKSIESDEAELLVHDRTILHRGDQLKMDMSLMAGNMIDPQAFAPLLELLGIVVADAVAERHGVLRIAFSNNLSLEIAPSHGMEAWHFRSTRQGRVATRPKKTVTVIGAHGHLIGFG